MNQTQAAIEHELAETALMAETLRIDQEHIAIACYQYFDYSARQIQRVFRGHLGRRVLRQLMALKAALRIQRAYRTMRARRLARLKRFRGICRRMLRGLRGVIAKQELSHKELLSRVNQNMLIDTQWRKAMGVADSENDLISALYRKKFMRKRIGTLFRQFYWIHSVAKYWRSLVPAHQPNEPQAAAVELPTVQAESSESHLEAIDEEPADDSKAFSSSRSLLDSNADSSALRGRPKTKPNEFKDGRRVVDREELRRRQRLYTERIYNENLKRETGRAAAAEKQREAARIAALQQQEQEDQQRLLRLQRAQQLRDDMDRRGQQILREMQSKKEEELRRQQEADARLRLARTKIATEVLSEETQHILQRRTKKTQEPSGSFMSI